MYPTQNVYLVWFDIGVLGHFCRGAKAKLVL